MKHPDSQDTKRIIPLPLEQTGAAKEKSLCHHLPLGSLLTSQLHLCHRPLNQATGLTADATVVVTQSAGRFKSQQVSRTVNQAAEQPIRQTTAQPARPPPVPANLVRNQLRLCLLSSPCLQLICFSLMQLSRVPRAERHNKVIRLIRLAAPLLSPYAHYTYSIRCVMRFCTPSTRCRCVHVRACVCMCAYMSERASALAAEICSIYILSLA